MTCLHRPLTVAVLVALSAAGCGGIRDAVLMPNPLVTGSVAANRSQEHRDYYEHLYQLEPGFADTEASITTLDDKQVCIKVKLRWISEKGEPYDNDSFVDVNQLIPTLTSQPPITVGKPRISDSILRNSGTQGRSVETEHGSMQICDNTGHHCETVLTKRNYMKDQNMSVRDGSGALCFAHNGTLTKQSRWLVLVLSPPAYPDKETHRFAWKFDPPPQK